MANNPTEIALSEAQHLFPDRSIDCIVSVGTGGTVVKAPPKGLLGTVHQIVNVTTNSNDIHNRVRSKMTKDPRYHDTKYFRLEPPGK